MSPGPDLARLHHVELYVRELETSARFWGFLLDRLGFRLQQEWDEGFSWAQGGSYLAFVQAPAPDRNYDRRRVGCNHIAFRARDRSEVDAITAALRERGVRVLYEDRHPYAGGPDHYALFVEDPDGMKVEVVAPGA